MAEGSFLVKVNLDACFQLKQRAHLELFTALVLLFGTTRKLDYTAGGKYVQLSMSSKADIQTVINFFSGLGPFSNNAGILAGHKLIQYNA